jgi:hypothetical protein
MPKHIAKEPKPSKQSVIEKHRSRMSKWYCTVFSTILKFYHYKLLTFRYQGELGIITCYQLAHYCCSMMATSKFFVPRGTINI